MPPLDGNRSVSPGRGSWRQDWRQQNCATPVAGMGRISNEEGRAGWPAERLTVRTVRLTRLPDNGARSASGLQPTVVRGLLASESSICPTAPYPIAYRIEAISRARRLWRASSPIAKVLLHRDT